MTAPITTITQAMCDDGEIHLLREVTLNLNGAMCSARLTFCEWSSGARYCVSGFTVDGKNHAKNYNTQDEAEQAWLGHAAKVQAQAAAMLKLLDEQMKALQDKLDGKSA